MNTILVATDLSDRSERALRRAVTLAEHKKARLVVLSVVDKDLPQAIVASLIETSKAELSQFMDSISAPSVEIRVEAGDVQTAIHGVADELDADLIVLGVHRARPFLDMVSGTTMTRLVKGTRRPVLLVRNPVTHDYKQMLSGLDFSPACLAALTFASRLVPEAQITCFHAVHIPFRGLVAPGGTAAQFDPFVTEAKDRLNAWLQENDLPANCTLPELRVGSVTEVLAEALASGGVDALVVGAHTRSRFVPNKLGSFTEDLLRNPPTDILVVRA